ncbi:MAG: hypothetical protein R3F14_09450 [Polyangiaceae bacterium]
MKASTGELDGVDGEDVAAAIELCGDLGLKAKAGLEKRAFGRLLGLGRDALLPQHARVALARMGHERAVREIVTELASWDREKRTLAVAAAGRARLTSARDAIAAMRDAPTRQIRTPSRRRCVRSMRTLPHR